MCRILIIDPNAPFRKSLGKSLSKRFPEAEILEAGSGVEGLTQLEKLTPQLIFIDIYLPDRSGLDLAKTIKQFYQQMVIAVFTRYDSPEYRAAANNSGVAHLIPKDDWTSEDILGLVENVLNQAGK